MKRTIRMLITAALLCLAASCRQDGPAVDADPADWLQEDEFHLVLPSGLRMDGYQLESPPALDPLSFTAVGGDTRAEIEGLTGLEQGGSAAAGFYFDGGKRCLRTLLQGKVVTACEVYPEASGAESEDVPQVVVEVGSNGDGIYTGEAGAVSPVEPLRGLWAADGSWILEYAEVSLLESGEDNSLASSPVGHLVADGRSWNDQYNLEEGFDFQLLDGTPFFFYQRDGQVGISYDGQETGLGFDEVPHYRCCSASVLNPRHVRDAVSFFGRKGGTWYYVEIRLAE